MRNKEKPFLLRMEEDIFKENKKESKRLNVSMNKLINFKLRGLKLTKK